MRVDTAQRQVKQRQVVVGLARRVILAPWRERFRLLAVAFVCLGRIHSLVRLLA
jgi:hypothetical protein